MARRDRIHLRVSLVTTPGIRDKVVTVHFLAL
jgi:hypothetical protein